MLNAYVIDAVRTPIGSYGGALSSVRPDDLAACVILTLMLRNPQINAEDIEDVIFGAANQAGEDNRNVARMALLLAGLPIEIGGVTVNRLCASGLQAIIDAARAAKVGEGLAFIAGGAESMSRAPFVMPKADAPFSRHAHIYDTTMGWRFINPDLAKLYHPYTMGETAENVAKQWNISRTEQDEFALASQEKYWKAFAEGKFANEIVPIEVQQNKKAPPVLISTDEHPRQTSAEKLAKLPPAFIKDGTVTAGNSSGINDGAAALLIVSETLVKQYQLQPLARIVSSAVAGVHPQYMGIGPVPATNKALQRAGLKMSDIDLVELNEAFASQSIACIRDLQLNPDIVNVNGGAIALGHPLGCSGARISATLLHELQRRSNVRYGLATMCIGVGQGAAIIYEKC